MSDVLASIGDDLVGAVRRRASRQRRRRIAAAGSGVAALAFTTVGLAAGVRPLDPLDGWLARTPPELAPPRQDVERVDVTVRGGAHSWRVVTYLARNGMVIQTASRDGGPPRAGGGGAVRRDEGRDGLYGIGLPGQTDGIRLVSGTVDARVAEVTVIDARGALHRASVSERSVAAPRYDVAEGRVDGSVELRAFAVTFPATRTKVLPRRARLRYPPVRFELRWRDGRVTRRAGPPGSG